MPSLSTLSLCGEKPFIEFLSLFHLNDELDLLEHIGNLLAIDFVPDIDDGLTVVVDPKGHFDRAFEGTADGSLDLEDDLVEGVHFVVKKNDLPGIA